VFSGYFNLPVRFFPIARATSQRNT
jgi:hypothetical protein